MIDLWHHQSRAITGEVKIQSRSTAGGEWTWAVIALGRDPKFYKSRAAAMRSIAGIDKNECPISAGSVNYVQSGRGVGAAHIRHSFETADGEYLAVWEIA